MDLSIINLSIICERCMNNFCCVLRGVLFIVRARNDIIKADIKHTKRTPFPTETKIGIHLEELK